MPRTAEAGTRRVGGVGSATRAAGARHVSTQGRIPWVEFLRFRAETLDRNDGQGDDGDGGDGDDGDGDDDDDDDGDGGDGVMLLMMTMMLTRMVVTMMTVLMMMVVMKTTMTIVLPVFRRLILLMPSTLNPEPYTLNPKSPP